MVCNRMGKDRVYGLDGAGTVAYSLIFGLPEKEDVVLYNSLNKVPPLATTLSLLSLCCVKPQEVNNRMGYRKKLKKYDEFVKSWLCTDLGFEVWMLALIARYLGFYSSIELTKLYLTFCGKNPESSTYQMYLQEGKHFGRTIIFGGTNTIGLRPR